MRRAPRGLLSADERQCLSGGQLSAGFPGHLKGRGGGEGPAGACSPQCRGLLAAAGGGTRAAVESKPVLPASGRCSSVPWTLKDTHPGLRTFL